jgi:hypothetical protein
MKCSDVDKNLHIVSYFYCSGAYFNTEGDLNVYIKLRFLMYIQQYATLHSLFYLETSLHVSGGISTHHQERKNLYLQHLVFVTLLLLSADSRR